MRYLALATDYDGTLAHHGDVDTPTLAALERVLGIAAQTSFRSVAILPAILLVVFGAIWLFDRSIGGYRSQKL